MIFVKAGHGFVVVFLLGEMRIDGWTLDVFVWWVGKCFVVYKSMQICVRQYILHGHNFAEYSIITLQYLHYIDHVFCLTPVRSC